MKAVNNYIVVEKLKEESKNISGFVITEDVDVDNRYIKGKIKSVGNLVEGLQEDDIIYYDKHAGHGIVWDNSLYYVIRLHEVVLVE